MSTYIVGDIQGCFGAFSALLKKVAFDPATDRLWSVGDLINRGEDNISTLRWFYEHRHCVTVVLGNHDLHVLASRAGAGRVGKSDNFDDVLNAPDAEPLLDWLQQQPLLYKEKSAVGDVYLVHAGIPPNWSGEQAETLAREVEAVLKSPEATRFFRAMYGNEPWRWSDHLSGLPRLRVITNYFTRMRFCTALGGLDLKSKNTTPKVDTIDGMAIAPWFTHPSQLTPSDRVFFGHWAAINGETGHKQFIGLDTGCVWGGTLTFYELETGKRWEVDNPNA